MEPSLSVRRFYWEVIDAWNEVNDYDPPGSFTIVSQAGFCLTEKVFSIQKASLNDIIMIIIMYFERMLSRFYVEVS